MKIRIIRSEREVSDFLDSCLYETTAFGRLDILQTLLVAFDRRFLWLGMYSGEVLEGVALLLVQRKGPLGIVQRLPTRYVGIVGKPESIPNYLAQLKAYLAALGIGRAFYSFSPWSLPDKEQLRERGYEAQDVPTMILPIRGDNVLLVADRRVRESVRKATRQGVRVRPSTEREMRNMMPGFLQQTYNRRNMKSPYPVGAPGIIWERHHGDAHVRMATTDQSGVALGIMVSIRHRERAYSWLIARDYSQAENLNVNALLIYDAAEWAAQEGVTELDLGGGPPGIREFKRRLGAEELTYREVHGTHPLYVPVFRLRDEIKSRRLGSTAFTR